MNPSSPTQEEERWGATLRQPGAWIQGLKNHMPTATATEGNRGLVYRRMLQTSWIPNTSSKTVSLEAQTTRSSIESSPTSFNFAIREIQKTSRNFQTTRSSVDSMSTPFNLAIIKVHTTRSSVDSMSTPFNLAIIKVHTTRSSIENRSTPFNLAIIKVHTTRSSIENTSTPFNLVIIKVHTTSSSLENTSMPFNLAIRRQKLGSLITIGMTEGKHSGDKRE